MMQLVFLDQTVYYPDRPIQRLQPSHTVHWRYPVAEAFYKATSALARRYYEPIAIHPRFQTGVEA